MSLFGDGAFRKIINVKWGHNGWALIYKIDAMPCRVRMKGDTTDPPISPKEKSGKTMWAHNEKMAVYRPR